MICELSAFIVFVCLVRFK